MNKITLAILRLFLFKHETVELMQIVIDAIHEKNEREKDDNTTRGLSDGSKG